MLYLLKVLAWSLFCWYSVVGLTYAEITVPSEVLWLSSKDGLPYSSHVDACSATMNTQWYKNFREGECRDSSCDCIYDYENSNGAVNKNIYAQNWVVRTNICPDGMFLTQNPENSYPGSCSGTPKKQKQCPLVGNPINPVTGAKYQVEEDYTSSTGLKIVRYYSSQNKFNIGFGWGWSSNLIGQRLKVGEKDLLVYHANGLTEAWSYLDGNWHGEADSTILIEETPQGFKLLRKNLQKELYSKSGVLQSIEYSNGNKLSYEYDESTGALISISNKYAQRIIIDMEGRRGRINSIEAPGAYKVLYTYDKGSLKKVTHPDATPDNQEDNPSRLYHYQLHPVLRYALTGITDERGVRFASWSYDVHGRSISSSHGNGLNKFSLAFSSTSSSSSVTVTNPLGKNEVYQYKNVNGAILPHQIDGIATDSCAAASSSFSYDENGLQKGKTDKNGSFTEYSHDDRGYEVKRVEAKGSTVERSISTQWHEDFRLPVEISTESKQIVYQYDEYGRLLKKTESSL